MYYNLCFSQLLQPCLRDTTEVGIGVAYSQKWRKDADTGLAGVGNLRQSRKASDMYDVDDAYLQPSDEAGAIVYKEIIL